METKFLIDKCSLIPSEGSSLKENYDIVRGNPMIDYYESIESPSIAMTISFFDTDQVITREGITGGEYVDVSVKIDGFDDFKIKSKKHKLMLNSVRNVTTETNKQMATLEFLSVEAIINETARVNKRFDDNVSQTVFELLIGDKKGIRSSKKLEKDRATNKYTFIGNLKRPFDTIQWLCPKAQSSNKNFGFLFYETLDGYNFRSIEKLLEEKPEVYEKPDRPIAGSFRIIENNLNQSNDIGHNCRMGMYANKTIYIDLENETYKEEEFKITELKPKLKKPPKLPDKLEDKPTRLMFRILDQGALQKGSKKEDVEKRNELAVYQNKSYIRNSLLFSQSLNISIPINPDLRAGGMIDVQLPLKKGDDGKPVSSYGSEKDDDVSGKYLISELRHLIGGGKAETQLELVRDAFTA